MESFLIYIFFRSTRKLYLYLQLYKATEEKSIENHLRACNIKYKHCPLFFIHGLYCIGMAQAVLTTVISRKLATLGRCFLQKEVVDPNIHEASIRKGVLSFLLQASMIGANKVPSLYPLNNINLPKDKLFFFFFKTKVCRLL